jgi:transcriptional regulator with XRE-family HTH domain
MTHESLARRLRVLRAARGITLAEAEELTGVTRETLGALEHGQRGAYTSTLEKIARGYGTTVSALLEEPEVALAGSSPKAEAPDTGPSALAPWAAYARRVAARTRSHAADPHSPAFRDAWAALFFVEERNRDAAELWLLFEEELGREPLADEPLAAFNAALEAFEELAEALAEAQRRAEQMAAGFAESEIGQARHRLAEAAAQREQAAARISTRLERRGA